jgi:hypothetical protein
VGLYPEPWERRPAVFLADLRRRVQALESRTAGIDSGWPLMAVPAVIDPGYASGDPMAYVNGSTALTGPYKCLSSYTPAAGNAVLMIPVVAQHTYVVLGRLT